MVNYGDFLKFFLSQVGGKKIDDRPRKMQVSSLKGARYMKAKEVGK